MKMAGAGEKKVFAVTVVDFDGEVIGDDRPDPLGDVIVRQVVAQRERRAHDTPGAYWSAHFEGG